MSGNAVRDAWCKVGDELEALGLKFKLHLEQERSDDGDVESMFDRLAHQVDAAIDAVEHAAGDDAVRDDLRETRQRLVDAVSTTLRTATDEIRRAAAR